jgi:energy-coupling factor transporter ATP-binding protein EcfA2
MELTARIAKIANFFRRSSGGDILFVVCNSTDAIRQINAQVLDHTVSFGLHINIVPLSSDNIHNFVNRIRENTRSQPHGLIITNFDEMIRIAGIQALRDINMARDVLIGLNTPLLFWFSEKNISRLANQAIDLFSRRSRALITFKAEEFPDSAAHSAANTVNVQTKRLQQLLQAHTDGILDDDTLNAAIDGMVKQPSAGTGNTITINLSDSVSVTDDLSFDQATNDPDEALAIYCRVLENSVRSLPLRGIDLGSSDPDRTREPMQLDQLYVALDTTIAIHEQDASDHSGLSQNKEQEQRPLSVLEAVIKHRCMVLLGDPGSGKSTFVNHLTLCLTAHQRDPGGGWLMRLPQWPDADADLIPLPVMLRDFARWLPSSVKKAEPQLLWDFIADRLDAQNLSFAADPLQSALEHGRVIVLLDGLDEISSAPKRIRVRDAVDEFSRHYGQSRFIVTCRVLSYQNPDWQLRHFRVLQLAPFDEKMINRFIKAWYAELNRLGEIPKREEAQNLSRQLQKAVRRPDLWRLAPNPLLLTVMALVNTHKGRLPDARALLYEDTVDILLWRWDQIKAAGEDTLPRLSELLMEAERTDMDLKKVFWRLAFDAHRESGDAQDDVLADIKERQLVRELAKLHPHGSLDWVNQVIETIKLRAGLLLEREAGLYTFPHRTFQEYLAGCHLASKGQFADEASKLATEGAFWREVILLAVGRMVYLSGEENKPLALVNKLCPEKGRDNAAAWRSAWLAGDVLLEIGLNRVQDNPFGKQQLERVQNRLAALVEKGRLEPAERVAAGNTLARIGDPRFVLPSCQR